MKCFLKGKLLVLLGSKLLKHQLMDILLGLTVFFQQNIPNKRGIVCVCWICVGRLIYVYIIFN